MAASIPLIIKDLGESLKIADLTANGVDADTDGDTFANSQVRLLAVYNGSGASVNVTIEKQLDSLPVKGHSVKTIADIVTAVPAGEMALIRVPDLGYNDASNAQLIDITYSAVTDVSVACVEFL